jgi:polyhydroxyalkanoate synthesis regulator phasin
MVGGEAEISPDSPATRVPRRLDRLVASGRMTPSEAQRLETAAGPAELDEALTAVRVRHASAVLDQAVASGGVTRDEADLYLLRMKSGEHSADLRREIAQLVRSDHAEHEVARATRSAR